MKELLALIHHPEVLSFIKKTELQLKNVPHLPKAFLELLVSVGPYLSLIGGILSIINGIKSLTGMGYEYRIMETFGLPSSMRYVSGIEQLLVGAIGIWAFNYLKARQFTGWLLMFWSMVVTVIFSIIQAILYSVMGLFGTALIIIIGGYMLFELKPFYKKAE